MSDGDARSPWVVPLSDIRPGPEVVAAVDATVAGGWWSMGPRVAAFEEAFGAFCGTKHALAVANGTAALQLALAALDCGPGDEVILPSLTFVAAANAVVLAGATPVFCDITGDDDLNLDPRDLAARLTERTKAVILLHYGGLPCDIDAVLGVCSERGVRVIEDAAHAIGATYRGRAAGSLGEIGCFSLFSNKNLPVGEGGVVVTDDDELAERLRLLRSHGMTTLTWDRHRGHANTYDVLMPGFNFRLDEIHAALALAQLPHVPEWNERRGAIVRRYREELGRLPAVTVPAGVRAGASSSHHLAVAVFDSAELREHVAGVLRDDRVQTSLHYPPIHRFSAYRSYESTLPKTESVAPRLMTLPLYPHLDDAGVETVVASVARALR